MEKIYMLLLIGIVVAVNGCLSDDGERDTNTMADNNRSTLEYIEDIETEVKIIKEINTFEGLEPTSKPQFKVGETYIYTLSDNFMGLGRDEPCDPVEINIPVHVERIERINKSEYYVLKSERYESYPACYITVNGQLKKIYVGEPKKPGDIPNPVIYGGCMVGINKDNASGISLGENFGICEEIEQIQPIWALYLKEDTNFIQESTIEIFGKECTERIETIVEGSEKINDWGCFKVKRVRRSNCRFSNEGQKATESEQIYYIDKQKRITVKYEHYEFFLGGRFLLTSLELKEIKE